MGRADELVEEHGVDRSEAEERAQAESDAGQDPYRPELSPNNPDARLPELEPLDDWLQWRT